MGPRIDKVQAQDPGPGEARKRESEVHGGEFWSASARKVKFSTAADEYIKYEKEHEEKAEVDQVRWVEDQDPERLSRAIWLCRR